jgi:hypothetical protein
LNWNFGILLAQIVDREDLKKFLPAVGCLFRTEGSRLIAAERRELRPRASPNAAARRNCYSALPASRAAGWRRRSSSRI